MGQNRAIRAHVCLFSRQSTELRSRRLADLLRINNNVVSTALLRFLLREFRLGFLYGALF